MTTCNRVTAPSYHNYFSIPLLLSNKKRDGLFTKVNSNSLVIIIVDHIGNALAYDSQDGGDPKTFESITDLVREFLGEYRGNTNSYLITPEMEIERIFNCLRYKYLNAIFISEIKNPQTCLSCTHNKAFQSLAGLKVYQGNPSQRRDKEVGGVRSGSCPLVPGRPKF